MMKTRHNADFYPAGLFSCDDSHELGSSRDVQTLSAPVLKRHQSVCLLAQDANQTSGDVDMWKQLAAVS